MSQIMTYLEKNQASMIASLKKLVMAESPSTQKHLVDHCGNVLSELFRQHLQVEQEIIPQTDVGNHLKFTCGHGDKQILVIGHFDTVWDPGHLPYRVDGERIYGPGILDMKGGLIQALWGMTALKELHIPLDKKVVFLCNSDEELGSVTSRSLIEKEAKHSEVALVVEPAQALTGALKTARKGTGMFQLNVKGVSAHAGNHHEKGASAIWELAKQIDYLQSLTDYDKGTTINVGTIRGGTRRNVVPESAEAIIDVRVQTKEEADRIVRIFENLQPQISNTSLHMSGGINRPPMERNDSTVRLFAIAQSIAAELGIHLEEAMVGGASDGNFTSALGVPTLDGLGAIGDGPHAENEHVLIAGLVQRAALFAHLVAQL